GERPALQAADADQVGARGEALDDVGAAAERAIDDDLGATADGLNHFRQYMHGAAAVVELAAAVIGDVDALDAVIERDLGVLGGADAFDDQRDLVLVLDQLHRAPAQSHLIGLSARASPSGGDVALGEVALAPAVMRGVDGEAEGGITVGYCAL